MAIEVNVPDIGDFKDVPIIGILDTNCDPDEVDFAIPGNDDAIRSVALLTRIIADAVADGLVSRSQGATASGEAAEPMAEWERELLEQAAPAQSSAETEKVADVADARAEAAELVDRLCGGGKLRGVVHGRGDQHCLAHEPCAGGLLGGGRR